MEAFYVIVLTIATAILISILTAVGIAIRKANREVTWPPTGGRCPDGWEEDATTPGKCYMRSDMVNSGKVTPESSVSSGGVVANSEKGYAFAANDYKWLSGDKWRECGSIKNINGKILYADDKSNFDYFKTGDSIKVGTFEAIVASKNDTAKTLTIVADLSPLPTTPAKFYGKRISVDFDNSVYKGASDSDTICKRKTWTDANEIQWDGVSNYNKCP